MKKKIRINNNTCIIKNLNEINNYNSNNYVKKNID